MTMLVVRYLWSVFPHFSSVAVGASGLALFGGWAVKVMPGDFGAAYVPLLFGQLFGASCGFRQAADSGYLDRILVSGARRVAIGAVHLALSAGPGLLAWVAVYGAELYVLGRADAVGLRPQYVLSLVLVSSVAWAISLPSGRFVGGVVWIGAIALVASYPNGLAWLAEAVSAVPDTGEDIAAATAAMILCPFLFLVPSLEYVSGNAWVFGVTMAVAATAVSAGVCWIVRRDFPGAT